MAIVKFEKFLLCAGEALDNIRSAGRAQWLAAGRDFLRGIEALLNAAQCQAERHHIRIGDRQLGNIIYQFSPMLTEVTTHCRHAKARVNVSWSNQRLSPKERGEQIGLCRVSI